MSKGLRRTIKNTPADQRRVFKQVYEFENAEFTVEAPGPGDFGTGNLVVEGLPDGDLLFLAASLEVGFTVTDPDPVSIVDTFSSQVALGSGVAPAGATFDADAQDLIQGTAAPTAVSLAVASADYISDTTTAGLTLTISGSDKVLNLNVRVTDGEIASAKPVSFFATGRLAIAYIMI